MCFLSLLRSQHTGDTFVTIVPAGEAAPAPVERHETKEVKEAKTQERLLQLASLPSGDSQPGQPGQMQLLLVPDHGHGHGQQPAGFGLGGQASSGAGVGGGFSLSTGQNQGQGNQLGLHSDHGGHQFFLPTATASLRGQGGHMALALPGQTLALADETKQPALQLVVQ